MNTLIGKALFRVARALRVISALVGGLTGLALIASPFVVSSFTDWLAIAGVSVGAAIGAYLLLYRGLPNLLARWAVAILPDRQMGYANAELAIWAHENRHGLANAAVRREFHEAPDPAGEDALWHPKV